MEIVHPLRRERDCRDQKPHPGDEYMDHLRPLLEEDVRHGADQSRAEETANIIGLLEENARLRGLVVRLSSIIIKSIADQK